MTTAGCAWSGSRAGDSHGMRAPSRLLWLAEYRALWEAGFSISASPLLLGAPRGDGHPVLVLPGFLVGDLSTTMLRGYLKLLGYETHGWELGRNFGGIARMRVKLRERLTQISEQSARKVSVVGWSLGGVYARDLALAMPDAVRSVITLGSPFSRSPNASNISDVYEFVSGEGPWDNGEPTEHEFDAIAGDLPMPATSIWSKVDGVVTWRSSVVEANAHAENIEVIGASHIGLGANAAVLWAIADRLALPDGSFTPFARGGPFAVAYGSAR